MESYELVLTGGRLLDPGAGVDQVGDIGFRDGLVAAIGTGLTGKSTLDVTGCIVMPGMIDFHAHVYWGGTSLGVDGDMLARRCGTTTWVDAGSAGPGNLEGFRRHVIERQDTRVLAFLHVRLPAFSASPARSWWANPGICDCSSPQCARGLPGSTVIWSRGIKVRVGAGTSGPNGILPLHLALEAAELAELPVMCHIDRPSPRLDEVLALLRPRRHPDPLFSPGAECARAAGRAGARSRFGGARARGAFDIGHGMGSFAFTTAETALAAGFPPDVISSDVHALCVEGPAYDNLVTMSKFLGLGMPLPEIVRAVTVTPARLLGRPDLGTLAVGTTGDATVLEIEEGSFDQLDVTGASRRFDRRLRLRAVVLGGGMWHPPPG